MCNGCLQVVKKEKASIKADIWSYGVLIWEITTGADITEYQPLAMSRQMGLNGKKTVTMPTTAPAVARQIFEACTQMEPKARPTATQIVEWLRQAEGA